MRDWLLNFEKENESLESFDLYKQIINIPIKFYFNINDMGIIINNIEFIYDHLQGYHYRNYGLTIPDYLISEDLIDKNKFIIERLKRL